jgi:hypothetical protein
MPLLDHTAEVAASAGTFAFIEVMARMVVLPTLMTRTSTPPSTSTKPSRGVRQTEAETKLAASVVSIAHDVFALVLAIMMALRLTAHPEDPTTSTVPTELLFLSGFGSVGYTLYDTGHVLLNREVYRGTLVEVVSSTLHPFVLDMLVMPLQHGTSEGRLSRGHH